MPFPTAREAEIAYNSLRVDPEPKRSGVQKQLSVDGVHLCVYVFKLLFGASQDSTTTGYQEQVVRVQATEQARPSRQTKPAGELGALKLGEGKRSKQN